MGRHAAAVDFLRASGFLDADDAEAEAEEERKGGLSGQPKWLRFALRNGPLIHSKENGYAFYMVEVATF